MPLTLIDYVTELRNTPGSAMDIATAVWTAVTRSLTVDPATDAGLATLVWSHASRSLTGLGTGVITAANAINQAVASGVLVDLRPTGSPNKFRFGMYGKVGNVSTSWTIGQYDGVTYRPEATVPSLGAILIPAMIGSTQFGFATQNTGTISDNFNLSGFDWAQ